METLRSRFLAILVVVTAVSLLTACGTCTVWEITDFIPSYIEGDIPSYTGKLPQPHRVVAILQSSSAPDKTPETKLALLEEIKGIAKEMGVDALEEIRLLTVHIRGLISDTRPPIPALQQAVTERYILRANAVVFDE